MMIMNIFSKTNSRHRGVQPLVMF